MKLFVIFFGMLMGAGTGMLFGVLITGRPQLAFSPIGLVAGAIFGAILATSFGGNTKTDAETPRFPPQIVGNFCAACANQIIMRTDGQLCAGCNRVFCVECEPRMPCSGCVGVADPEENDS